MTATDAKAEVRSRPILFSGPMVRAILDGRKHVTRRIIKGVFRGSFDGPPPFDSDCIKDWDGGPSRLDIAPDDWEICPYGVPGDELWVRESAYIAPPNFCDPADANRRDDQGRPRVVGWAASMDGEAVRCAEEYGVRKTPSILMPRWASRITLEITGVRVERLHDITEQDAIAEGVRPMVGVDGLWVGREGPGRLVTPWPTAREAFRDLWESINGKSSWDNSPWVWVVEFRRLEPA